MPILIADVTLAIIMPAAELIAEYKMEIKREIKMLIDISNTGIKTRLHNRYWMLTAFKRNWIQ
jgi:hypothetical protein